MLITSEAIVLKKIDYGETSLICTIFTKKAGKVTIIAKGAKNKKSSIKHILEPFNILNLSFYYKEKRNIQILKEALIEENFMHIRENYNKIVYGLIFTEYINRVTKYDYYDPIAFKLIKSTFFKLNNSNIDNKLLYIFFCYQLINIQGFMINHFHCSNCSNKLQESVFDPICGFLCCKQCQPNGKFYFSSHLVHNLELISKIHLKNLEQISLNTGKLNELKIFLDLYIKFHINDTKNLRSLSLIKV